MWSLCCSIKFIASDLLFSFVDKGFIEKQLYKYVHTSHLLWHVQEHNTRFDDTMITIICHCKKSNEVINDMHFCMP